MIGASEDKIQLIVNKEKKWEVGNIVEGLKYCEHDDIVCRLDGDDWLCDTDALTIINHRYNQTGVSALWTAHRWSFSNQNISAEVNEFLAQMTDCSNRGIFVIAATNQPELIDEAILRTGRIDKIIYVPNPDSKAREKMFELYLKNRPTELSIDFKKLADMTENYVSSDIKYIIDQASRIAANKQIRIGQKLR